jgi:hypothetical protein
MLPQQLLVDAEEEGLVIRQGAVEVEDDSAGGAHHEPGGAISSWTVAWRRHEDF